MTTFLLSHNLQLASASVPPLTASELAEGLQRLCPGILRAEPLVHPHWLISLESSNDDPQALGRELVAAWASLRSQAGEPVNHAILALGGRKDTPAASGSPLDLGAWGVDVVETNDPDGFLQAIHWEGLKAGRPADGVFEVVRRAI
jgi:hypothetical protein